MLICYPLYSAIKVYHGNKVEPEYSEQFQSQLQDTVAATGLEEQQWRRRKIDVDRRTYQEELSANGVASKEGETGDARSSECTAISPESAKVVQSTEVVTVDIAGGSRSSSDMTYSELVANMEVPAGMQAFRSNLELSSTRHFGKSGL